MDSSIERLRRAEAHAARTRIDAIHAHMLAAADTVEVASKAT